MGEHDGHRSRLRKRFLAEGLDSIEDHNILELLLFYAQPRRDTNSLAHALLDTFGSLDAVFEAPPEALMKVRGVGESAAVLIRLIPEVARRYRIAKETDRRTVITSSRDIGRYLIPRFQGSRGETVYLVCLDPKRAVIACRPLSHGGPANVTVDIRQIVETALMQNAASVILAHNHPNGLALPSREDREVTKRVREALGAVGIPLVDHIIVSGEDFVSLYDSGLLG